MKYTASFSCKVGNYSVKWREWFQFKEDAEDILNIELKEIKRHFGEGNIKELKKSIRKVKS